MRSQFSFRVTRLLCFILGHARPLSRLFELRFYDIESIAHLLEFDVDILEQRLCS